MSKAEEVNNNCSNASREVTFPVPWGIIAAKGWGDPCSPPALMLHGIQDNAGTFDRLIPHLPRGFYYLCVDFPGHGFSSRFPKGRRLDLMDYVLSVNRVVRQTKWPSFTLIGHSLGGQVSQYYAAIYPEQVTKLVVLDAYGPAFVPFSDFLDFNKRVHEEVIAVESKMLDAEPPSYTYEIALQKMIDNRRSPITREAAEKLVPRNLKRGKNGFYFSPDQRLKLHVSLPLSYEQHYFNYKNIKCPFLLIVTKDLFKLLGLDQPKNTLIGAFMENPQFEMVIVDGHHDVHNISPKIVAPHVSKFLLRQKSLL